MTGIGVCWWQAAEEEHRRLVEGGVLGEGVSYGLLHGRLSAEEKADALAAFAAGRTTVLIATTVVEVNSPSTLTAVSVTPLASLLSGSFCWGVPFSSVTLGSVEGSEEAEEIRACC